MSIAAWAGDLWPRLVLDPVFRRMLHPPMRPPRALPENMAVRAEDLTIPGPTMPMKAWLLRAGGSGVAVFVHGWSSDGGRMAPLAQHLLDAGVSCLLVDLPGHGRTGRTRTYHAGLMLEDLRSVADYIAARGDLREEGAAILGYSFGGLGAIASAATDGRWAALVVMATPLGPMEATEIYLQRKGLPARWLRKPLHRVAQRIVGIDPDTFTGAHHLPSLKVPALFVHGKLDEVVPQAHAEGLHGAAPPGSAELLLVEGAGHDALLAHAETGRRVAAFLARVLAQARAR